MKLDQEYDRDDLINFLKNDFLQNFTKDIRPINQSSNTKTINSANYLGECSDFDLQVFELETSGKSDKKISQALDSFRLLREYQSYRALVAYYSKDDANWRFALLQMTPDLSDKGKVVNKYSNPRRYSFLLGPHAKIRTPEKYLIKDGQVKDFKDLQRRFSVEVVNKDFYREIARYFIRLVGGDTKLGSNTEHFKPELHLPSIDADDHKTYQEYTVRLIGRIIFCWFLKQKKSQEGISLLPEEFLSSYAVKNAENYYHSILEPIFFEVLNKPKESRKPQFRNGYDKIPYLNGGLFDPHYDDFYEGQPNFALKIPNEWFVELFEVLETYNFTIDENTSLDVDLSIDPEMLGRIFENLLAEINPETGESARKSTGSYYTPRQIVEYMVDQSLLQYLLTKTGISQQKLEALISVDSSDDEQFPLTDQDKQKVVNALDEVKIIDPACGSGAFPIGILQKIVWILGKVDTNGKLWFDKKLEGLDPLLHEDFKQKFQNENFDYIRKTGVIRDSIYGVDIQPIAVEVSKLRSFLTLIVDEDIDELLSNRGIKPLPNLEFKFVAANSLICLPDSANSNNKQMGMFEDTVEIGQLKYLRDLYFVSNGLEKEKIKSKFKDVQRQMFKNQVDKGGHGKLTMALADWDPFASQSAEWFDQDWMFGVSRFDIVIANPPYGANIDNLMSYFRSTYLDVIKNYADIYKIFFSFGIGLLETGGILTYISPNTYLSQPRYKDIRNCLLRFNIKNILNLGLEVFEGAVVPTCITIIQNDSANDKYMLLDASVDSKYRGSLENLEEYSVDIDTVKKSPDFNLYNISSLGDDELYLDEIFVLKDAGIQYHRSGIGLKNKGGNDLYERLFSSDQNSFENSRPVWYGKLLSSYCLSKKSDEYFNLDYKSILRSNESVSFSKEAFSRDEKILWRQTASYVIATLDDSPHWFRNTVQCGWLKDEFSNKFEIKYILALLNSKYLRFLYQKIVNESSGRTFPQVKLTHLRKIPIKKIDLKEQKEFSIVVEDILRITSAEDYSDNTANQVIVKSLQNKIDHMTYLLYKLSSEEIDSVESAIK